LTPERREMVGVRPEGVLITVEALV
jgi:hypothetical protein